MRRMNSMLSGHQGASGRTDCMYFSAASRGGGVVPGERQVQDARGTVDVQVVRDGLFGLKQGLQQRLAGQQGGVVVDMEAADARRDVHDAGQGHGAKLAFQGVDPEAQGQVQHVRAELDQQIAVAVGAGDAREGVLSVAGCSARMAGSVGYCAELRQGGERGS